MSLTCLALAVCASSGWNGSAFAAGGGEKNPCEAVQGRDCNLDGILDACEIFLGLADDCDGNTIPDPCDVLTPNATASRPLNANATIDIGDEGGVDVVTRGDTWVAVWATNSTLGGTIGEDADIVFARSPNGGANWTMPVALDRGAILDESADIGSDVAGDGQGTLIAVWYTNRLLGGVDDDDWDIVFARSADDGETWSDPQPLHSNALTDEGTDWSPDIATDGNGTWVVAWYSSDPLGEPGVGGDRDIFFVRSEDHGMTWTDPAAIHSNAAEDSGWDSSPHVVTDGETWIVSWYSDDTFESVGTSLGTDRDIIMVRSVDGAVTWSDPRPLNANAEVDLGDDLVENIATDGRGSWLAVWYSVNNPTGIWGPDHDIMVARSSDAGATWTEPTALNSHAVFDTTWDSLPKIATDGTGYWVTVWQSEDSVDNTYGEDIDVLFSVSADDGLSWTATEAVNATAQDDEDGDYYDFGPSIVFDGLGRWKVFWISNNPMVDTGADEDLFFADLIIEDCNANAVPDSCDIADGSPDCGPNGIPDECEPDCNDNGVADSCDLTEASSADCNADDIPDECQDTSLDCNANGVWDPCDIDAAKSADCNGNFVPDECDLSAGSSPDCNANAVPDECDVVSAASGDCNLNVVPDECEAGGAVDCNANDRVDLCDIFLGASGDCNQNAVPDECDIAAGHSDDCAGEGIPDECEPDCNTNAVPDSCDIFSGDSEDCDRDTVPDDCQDTSADCNDTGLWDPCDISAGDSADCDFDLVPDECQDTSDDCNATGLWDPCDIAAGTSEDCNANLVPDECDAVNPSVRMFLAPDGLEFDAQRYCNTTLHMEPGTSTEISIWIEDNLQLGQITAIQPMIEMRARPLGSAVGTVEYVNLEFMGCTAPPEDFGMPCDPKDPGACNENPDVCSTMDGNSVFADESREDYVFFEDITAGPAYHETPLVIQEEEDVAVFGILSMRIPLDEGIFIAGTFYAGEFILQADEDASGVFSLKYNDVPTVVPTPLNTLFGRSGVTYELVELQELTLVVGDLKPVDSDPPNGAVDARQPTDLSGKATFGWDRVAVHFDRDAAGTAVSDFSVAASGGAVPQIESLTHEGSDIVVQLDRPTTPGECMTLRHLPSGVDIRLGFLPGDSNGDGLVGPLDILALVDGLNGVLDPPLEAWQCDINRSGVCEALDILTLIDLLNGAGAHEVWNGATLPPCPE